MTETDWNNFELYDRFRRISERALRQTSTAAAPWVIVRGPDPRYRYLTVGTELLAALRRRLDDASSPPSPPGAPPFFR